MPNPFVNLPTIYHESCFLTFWIVVMEGKWFDCYMSEEIKEMMK